MRRAVFAAVILAGAYAPAFAQAPGPFPNETERALLMELCTEAQWAARRRFDGICDYLRGRLDAVVARERAEAEKAKAKPDQPAQDQPKENPE